MDADIVQQIGDLKLVALFPAAWAFWQFKLKKVVRDILEHVEADKKQRRREKRQHKQMLEQFLPNGGTSFMDKMNRMEEKLNELQSDLHSRRDKRESK